MNTEKHITPETAPEYKTQKAIRLYVLWARNRKFTRERAANN